MSLEEAPVDRQPIQTYVMEYNDELIRGYHERTGQRRSGVLCV